MKICLTSERVILKRATPFFARVERRGLGDGCVGFCSMDGTTEAKLCRLYVKYNLKRQGIGTALLATAEAYLKSIGKTAAHVHLGGREYFESRRFYPRHGYAEYAPSYLKKTL